MGDADELRALAHEGGEVGEIKRHRASVQWVELEHHAPFLQPIQGADVGFVIGCGDDDLVAGRQLAVHGAGQLLQQGFSRVAEDDLLSKISMSSSPVSR